MSSQKSRRCYHRVISGLERGGSFRFLTLTSSNLSPDTCQRSWRCLYMRLKRRGLVRAYIKVPELSKNGKQHLHVILEGEYIAQAAISEMWQEIHHAKVVDIRRAYAGQNKNGLASYMAKYMAKDNYFRYSWSWSWVWKGFVKDWKALIKVWRYHGAIGPPIPFATFLILWRHFLHQKSPLFLRSFCQAWAVPADFDMRSI